MPKLTLSNIKTCIHPRCTNLGVAEDLKCLDHSECIRTSRPNRPEIFENPMGVELEFYTNRSDRIHLCKYAKCVKGDGSLDNGHGIEANFCHESGKVGRLAGRFLQVINPFSQTWVDDTCGMHVHLSMKGLTGGVDYYLTSEEKLSRYSKIANALAPMETEVYNIFPTRTEDRTEYSLPLNSSLARDYRRYAWLTGYSNHNTVECRLHPGTVNPDVVIAWTKVCSRLQQLCLDVLQNRTNTKTKSAKRGRFFTQFQKGTVARHYIDYRRDAVFNRYSEREILDNYKLPCA